LRRYLVGRPNKDPIVSARQIITHDWWKNELPKLEAHISRPVLAEAGDGDADLAQKRLEAIKDFTLLEEAESIQLIAQEYLDGTHLPEKCRVDCEHMATASFYSMDFMVSWNCKHIVNAVITKKIENVNDLLGLDTPKICTPEELYGVDNA